MSVHLDWKSPLSTLKQTRKCALIFLSGRIKNTCILKFPLLLQWSAQCITIFLIQKLFVAWPCRCDTNYQFLHFADSLTIKNGNAASSLDEQGTFLTARCFGSCVKKFPKVLKQWFIRKRAKYLGTKEKIQVSYCFLVKSS